MIYKDETVGWKVGKKIVKFSRSLFVLSDKKIHGFLQA